MGILNQYKACYGNFEKDQYKAMGHSSLAETVNRTNIMVTRTIMAIESFICFSYLLSFLQISIFAKWADIIKSGMGSSIEFDSYCTSMEFSLCVYLITGH